MAWIKHGHRRSPRNTSPTWHSWRAMIGRTSNPGAADFHRYGGRGIAVCGRWRESFKAFLADMGERPAGTTLDRFPRVDGHYEPGNCRWATPHEQGRNKRNNVLITFRGKTQCIAAWAEEVDLPRKTLERRLRKGKMDLEASMTTPVIPRSKRALMGIASRIALIEAGLAKPRKTPERQTHCKWGHPRSGSSSVTSRRWCQTCNRLTTQASRAKKKAAQRAAS